MDINQIAQKLNEKSKNYKIGELQTIRKKIKNLSKKPSSEIFSSQTVFNHSKDTGWAFHLGGRSELQFNIGIENEYLRYGVAFSLETSQSLPDLKVLYPKVLRLNNIIRENPQIFKDFKMWYWKDEKRSKTENVKEISAKLIQPGTFIFIGKLVKKNNIDFDEILETFDDLLQIYIEVEDNNNRHLENKPNDKTLVFKPGLSKLPKAKYYTSIEKEINIDVRHSIIQERLYNFLTSLFGEKSVGTEIDINGNRVDVVLKGLNNEFAFFEIKVSNSAKTCIRQALGQLLEYAYYDGQEYTNDFFIVGEHPIDEKTEKYLRFINEKFNLNFKYININKINKNNFI